MTSSPRTATSERHAFAQVKQCVGELRGNRSETHQTITMDDRSIPSQTQTKTCYMLYNWDSSQIARCVFSFVSFSEAQHSYTKNMQMPDRLHGRNCHWIFMATSANTLSCRFWKPSPTRTDMVLWGCAFLCCLLVCLLLWRVHYLALSAVLALIDVALLLFPLLVSTSACDSDYFSLSRNLNFREATTR